MMTVAYKKEMKVAESTESCVIKALTYFSIFQYPLSKEEIRTYLHPDAEMACLEDVLENLVNRRCIFKMDEFYSLHNNILLVKRRRDGNLRASQLLPKAMKIGKFLFKFPYVRGIGISGSLSKMYADEKADIDFFIITKSDRLWIARTFMHLFKKLTFLTGKQHFYCMNYYVDESAMKLEDQNIYTAIEISTLLPVRGEAMHDFFKANSWVSDWFAEYPGNNKKDSIERSWGKRTIEWLLNNKTGNRLDNYLMKITTRRWQKKKRKGMRNEEGKEMDLITGKHFARSNPGMFQEKLLVLYQEKLNEMKRLWPDYF